MAVYTRVGVVDMPINPMGYQQITSLSSSTTLTVPSGSNAALIQAQDNNVRWRDDGTAPTTSVGMLHLASAERWYIGDLSALRFIETTASAVLNVSYYFTADLP